jgi:hypothetical protein
VSRTAWVVETPVGAGRLRLAIVGRYAGWRLIGPLDVRRTARVVEAPVGTRHAVAVGRSCRQGSQANESRGQGRCDSVFHDNSLSLVMNVKMNSNLLSAKTMPIQTTLFLNEKNIFPAK